MADLGEEILIETTIEVDGVAFDPGTVTLTVIAPDTTETTPSVNNPATGEYNVVQTVDQVGRWLWKWTTTTPDGVDWGFEDVTPNPPALLGLLPLATVADLEARIGTLDTAKAQRAPALLEDASALVRAECRQDFTVVTDDVVTLRSTGSIVPLPKRPVTSVSQVVAVGIPPTQDLVMPESSWVFDGVDKIHVTPNLGWILNLPEVWSTDDYPGVGSYRVTYSHGSVIPPAEIKQLVCHMVGRTITAPAVSDLVSQSIGQGDFSWQAQQGAGAMGTSVRLTAGDREKLVNWGYIRDYGTTETAVR